MNGTTNITEGKTMTNTMHKILTDSELELVCGGRGRTDNQTEGSSGNIEFNYQLQDASSAV